MEDPLQTRALTGLATVLFTLGLAIGVVGFHPSVHSPTITRIGVVVALTSLPPWITVATRRAGQLSQEQMADAHLAGWQQAMEHIEQTGDGPQGGAAGGVPRPVGDGPHGGPSSGSRFIPGEHAEKHGH
jgi:hypothetical protein